MHVFGTETHMTAIVGMALGKREVPKQVGFDSNAAANMFFTAQDKVTIWLCEFFVVSYHKLSETCSSSSHRTLFQADSTEICRHFNKFITLHVSSVVLCLWFPHLLLQMFLFLSDSWVSLILLAILTNYSVPVPRCSLETPEEDWVGNMCQVMVMSMGDRKMPFALSS